jgi:hypothetical protein
MEIEQKKKSFEWSSMLNQVGPKNMCKKIRETCATQTSMVGTGGEEGGYYLACVTCLA